VGVMAAWQWVHCQQQQRTQTTPAPVILFSHSRHSFTFSQHRHDAIHLYESSYTKDIIYSQRHLLILSSNAYLLSRASTSSADVYSVTSISRAALPHGGKWQYILSYFHL
jgi:hypothetical protein